jgi:hypothetical protein
VDLARDLIDHRIADLEDQDAGMVDDLWVTWHHGTAALGPIVTGAAALLTQVGPFQTMLIALSRRIRCSHARVWREIPWRQVRRIERPQVKLLVPRADLAHSADRSQTLVSDQRGQMLYSQLCNLPVATRDHQRLGIIDVRTAPLISEPPQVLGLLIAPHPRRRSLGLKQFDTTAVRLGGIPRGGRYLPWEDISRITSDAIHTNAASGELAPLATAPNPQPPPMPEGATPP